MSLIKKRLNRQHNKSFLCACQGVPTVHTLCIRTRLKITRLFNTVLELRRIIDGFTNNTKSVKLLKKLQAVRFSALLHCFHYCEPTLSKFRN